MSGYMPRTYTLRRRPSVEANRFDGTLEMARWLEDQDDEHLRVMRTLFSTDPAQCGAISLSVYTTTGERTCRSGDWILNDNRGDWNVMSDSQFRACYDTDDPTDPDDPYNRQEPTE